MGIKCMARMGTQVHLLNLIYISFTDMRSKWIRNKNTEKRKWNRFEKIASFVTIHAEFKFFVGMFKQHNGKWINERHSKCF